MTYFAKGVTDEQKNRIRQRQKVVVTACVAFSVLYVAVFWLNQIFCTPCELYQRAWKLTDQYFFDREALDKAGFEKLKNKYDSQISDYPSAEKSIAAMLKPLDDPFTNFLNMRETSRQADAHDGFYSGVGMVMNGKTHPISVRQVMDGSPAKSAGVKKGDLILSVGDLDCSKIPALKIGEFTREHMYEKVHFLMSRGGQKLDFILVPSKIPVAATVSSILPGNIAYERVEGFMHKKLPELVLADFEKMKSCRALILDLRGNPGGSVDLCLEVASTMLDSGKLVSLKNRNGDGSYLTSTYILTAREMIIEAERQDKEEDKDKQHERIISHKKRQANVWDKKPIIVLVDDNSASAAEMVAAALAENDRATLVGERTYGKGVAQLYFPLPMGTMVSVTAGRYFTPSGRWLGNGKELSDAERLTAAGLLRGIKPRYIVKASKDLEYGKDSDNQLKFAVGLLGGGGEIKP
jgi:carboxyl-terminal processing protease